MKKIISNLNRTAELHKQQAWMYWNQMRNAESLEAAQFASKRGREESEACRFIRAEVRKIIEGNS